MENLSCSFTSPYKIVARMRTILGKESYFTLEAFAHSSYCSVYVVYHCDKFYITDLPYETYEAFAEVFADFIRYGDFSKIYDIVGGTCVAVEFVNLVCNLE